mmetsp:Transcript_76908/g.222301  ORF Transcript_76908/g.222301 Transcript_76908/m.222301 type:complete len:663 (-) Transcript_76908:341-2329(-)
MLRACVFTSLVSASAAQWYGVVIDAGSSGSRLRIYNASAQGVTEVQPRPNDASIFETEPGLASFAGHPQGAGASLAGLVEAAKAYIPLNDYARTRIWLKATAGMRSLPQERLEAIFRSVHRFLTDDRNCPFKPMSTGVLGGEEEAVYAFLGINEMVAPSPERSAGVLDMGGSSMQVAYKPSGNILDGEFHFYMKEERQSVYARSWPQFGLDTALARALVHELHVAGPEATAIEFPCFHRGFSETIELDDRHIHVSGGGDNKRCGELSLRLLHREYDCLLPPCPFMGVHMPQLTGKEHFYAMSNFFYVPNGLGLVGWDERKPLKPSELKAATETFCTRSFQDVSGEESRQSLKYRRNFCFGGHYMWHILKAFGFDDDSMAVTSVRILHGNAADWTLGFVLYETEEMPRRRPVASPLAAAPLHPEKLAPLRMIGAPIIPVPPPEPPAMHGWQQHRPPGSVRGASPGPAPTAVVGQPCPAPHVITVHDSGSRGEDSNMDAEADAVIELAQAPSVLGIPGWYIWIAALFAASMFGWFAHHLPIQCLCCGCGYRYDEGPMSPASLFRGEGVPMMFRATSAPLMTAYLSVGARVAPSGSNLLGGQSPKLGGQSPKIQLGGSSPRLLNNPGPHSPKLGCSSPGAGQRPDFCISPTKPKREAVSGQDSAV